jgi:hypothetical protein
MIEGGLKLVEARTASGNVGRRSRLQFGRTRGAQLQPLYASLDERPSRIMAARSTQVERSYQISNAVGFSMLSKL